MKKSILTLLFLGLLQYATAQETKILSATFEGFDGHVFSFMKVDDSEEIFTFDNCATHVLAKYDLKSDIFLFEYFDVHYQKIENEEGDLIWTIIALELMPNEEEGGF